MLMMESDVNKPGYVYVLSNPYMPGLVKIGRSQRTATKRIKELSTGAGIPARFELEYQRYVSSHLDLERHLHIMLDGSRINPDREFFSCSTFDVIRKMDVYEGINIDQYELNEAEKISTVVSKQQKILSFDNSTKHEVLSACIEYHSNGLDYKKIIHLLNHAESAERAIDAMHDVLQYGQMVIS